MFQENQAFTNNNHLLIAVDRNQAITHAELGYKRGDAIYIRAHFNTFHA